MAKSPLAFAGPVFMGSVSGVKDSFNEISVCVPPEVKNGQLYAMVSRYLRDHPEEWNKSGDELVIRALRPTFPCAKK